MNITMFATFPKPLLFTPTFLDFIIGVIWIFSISFIWIKVMGWLIPSIETVIRPILDYFIPNNSHLTADRRKIVKMKVKICE